MENNNQKIFYISIPYQPSIINNIYTILTHIKTHHEPKIIDELANIGYEKLFTDLKYFENIKYINKYEKLGLKYQWDIIGIPRLPLNRPKFTWTDQQELDLQVRYDLLNKLVYADQWSLRTDKEMEILKKNNFKIECLGSPFNVRLPYFGSVFAEDEPFGRLGDCIHILKTLVKTREIKWRNRTVINKNETVKLIFSPAVYNKLILEIFVYLKKLFKTRKCEVYIGLPKTFSDLIDNKIFISPAFKYMLTKTTWSRKPTETMICFHRGHIDNTNRAPWYDYYFKN